MTFVLPSDTGGIPLSGMELRRDNGIGGNLDILAFSGDYVTTNYLDSNLTEGNVYRYQFRIRN